MRSSPPRDIITPEVYVRVTARLTGTVDGIPLSRFEPGFVYRVGTIMASYLFAMRAAVPVAPTEDACILPPHQRLFSPLPSFTPPAPFKKPPPAIKGPPPKVHLKTRAKAADRPRRSRRRKVES